MRTTNDDIITLAEDGFNGNNDVLQFAFPLIASCIDSCISPYWNSGTTIGLTRKEKTTALSFTHMPDVSDWWVDTLRGDWTEVLHETRPGANNLLIMTRRPFPDMYRGMLMLIGICIWIPVSKIATLGMISTPVLICVAPEFSFRRNFSCLLDNSRKT